MPAGVQLYDHSLSHVLDSIAPFPDAENAELWKIYMTKVLITKPKRLRSEHVPTVGRGRTGLAARTLSMRYWCNKGAAFINLRLVREYQVALARGPHAAPWQAPEVDLTVSSTIA